MMTLFLIIWLCATVTAIFTADLSELLYFFYGIACLAVIEALFRSQLSFDFSFAFRWSDVIIEKIKKVFKRRKKK